MFSSPLSDSVQLPWPPETYVAPYVAFDLETVALFADDVPAPDIACIGLAAVNPQRPDAPFHTQVWQPPLQCNSLSSARIDEFIDVLDDYRQRGYFIVTWGGMSGDWRLLTTKCSASHQQRALDCLLFSCIDVPFVTLCHSGIMIGLNTIAKSLKIDEKPQPSKSIPDLWANLETRHRVTSHVLHDATVTLKATIQITRNQYFEWKPSNWSEELLSQKQKSLPLCKVPCRFLPPCYTRIETFWEALTSPAPRTKWTPKPAFTREGNLSWLPAIYEKFYHGMFPFYPKASQWPVLQSNESSCLKSHPSGKSLCCMHHADCIRVYFFSGLWVAAGPGILTSTSSLAFNKKKPEIPQLQIRTPSTTRLKRKEPKTMKETLRSLLSPSAPGVSSPSAPSSPKSPVSPQYIRQ